MDFTRHRLHAVGLSQELTEFISSSIRESSCREYELAWQSWCRWCDAHAMEYTATTDLNLVSYLFSFFAQPAPTMLSIHRAAISSVSTPRDSQSSKSLLLHHFMRAAFAARPPSHSLPQPTWGVTQVLNHLHSGARSTVFPSSNCLIEILLRF